MNTTHRRFISCFTLAVLALSAQEKLTFDVASVKPAAELDQAKITATVKSGGKMPVGANIDSGRAEYTYMNLTSLIGLAYGIRPCRITGPDWLPSDTF